MLETAGTEAAAGILTTFIDESTEDQRRKEDGKGFTGERERKETRNKNEQKRSIRVSRVAAHENYVSENDAAA